MSVFHQYIQNICKVEPFNFKNLQLNHINVSNNQCSNKAEEGYLWGLFLTSVSFDICIKFWGKFSQNINANNC